MYADVTAPLQEYEISEIKRLTPLIAEKETERDIKKALHQKLKDEVVKAKDGEIDTIRKDALTTARDLAVTPIPTLPRLIASDATTEKLATLLQENGGRLVGDESGRRCLRADGGSLPYQGEHPTRRLSQRARG